MATYTYPLSPSSINKYLDCPYGFYLRYIRRIKLPPNDSAIFGSSVHKVNEMFWPEYTVTNDPDKAMQASIDKNWDKKVNPDYEKTAKECLDNFLSIIKESPRILPLYTEYKVHNSDNNTVAVIDVVYPSKIVDYKTSSQFTVKPKMPNIIQAVVCSENLKHCDGLEIKHVEFQYLRFKKFQSIDITQKMIDDVNSLISQVREGIKNDKFPKTEKSCWVCEYRMICEAEKRACKKKSEEDVCSKSGTLLNTNFIQ